MGKITGFLEIKRAKPGRRPVDERLKDWSEFEGSLEGKAISDQGARGWIAASRSVIGCRSATHPD